jgi:hypothetical protein
MLGVTEMKRRLLYVSASLIVVVLVFQFFFRYEYVQTGGGPVVRIDRLHATACIMPCHGTQARSTSPAGRD